MAGCHSVHASSMTTRLTALDATFLELEQADESAHMHIGGIMVFDPVPGGGAPARAAAPPLAGGGGAGRGGPRPAPAPGGERELGEWSSSFFSQRLDRHRPLWEIVILEGLAGDRWALATKTHHYLEIGR